MNCLLVLIDDPLLKLAGGNIGIADKQGDLIVLVQVGPQLVGEAALRTRQFEDDGPNWTPRISGIQANDGSYKMSILKAADPEGSACARFFWEYPATAGVGHFLHTYVCDGNPVIPTFQGEPERVSIPADMDAFVEELWQSLDDNNKISLFVRYTDIASGEFKQKIINKHN